jgi:hypothetical protein
MIDCICSDRPQLNSACYFQWRSSMTNLKLLSTGLIAVAMLAAPAMARESHVASRQAAMEANAAASEAPFNLGNRACVPAPRVGAFATAPWTGANVPCEPGTGAY